MAEPIQYYNRYTGQVETEAVYGERWLRLAYGNPLGRLGVWAAIRRGWFSRFYGKRMSDPKSLEKVEGFIKKFGLNKEDFADPDCYTCFNDFFIRRLKPEARPIDADERSVVFPADARHLGFQNFGATDGLLVKGRKFSLKELLGDAHLAAQYENGALVISRLCPTDYHRFHFPVSGLPGPAKKIPGPLDSVNPIALRRNINILARNARQVTLMRTEKAGNVLLVEVGAACVGTIVQTYHARERVMKGAEKGYFKFGGSTTITLFEPGRIQLADDLLMHSQNRRELYALMGDRMGTLTQA